MHVNIIKKYAKYSIGQLKKKAQIVFNAWIRRRDEGEPCISCGSRNTSTASHFYSAGHYNHMRFMEDNCHLSCQRCNYYLSGNLIEYRKRLEKKIGLARLVDLDLLSKQRGVKRWNRFELIDIIERYK